MNEETNLEEVFFSFRMYTNKKKSKKSE